MLLLKNDDKICFRHRGCSNPDFNTGLRFFFLSMNFSHYYNVIFSFSSSVLSGLLFLSRSVLFTVFSVLFKFASPLFYLGFLLCSFLVSSSTTHFSFLLPPLFSIFISAVPFNIFLFSSIVALISVLCFWHSAVRISDKSNNLLLSRYIPK